METNNGVYLTIETPECLTKMVKRAVNAGYLRKVDLRDVIDLIKTSEYPMQVPIDLDFVLRLGENAVVKHVFGRNIDQAMTDYIRNVKVKTGR